MFTGGIGDALAFVAEMDQTPNLWWPHDRCWCVATDVDDDVTHIGSVELITALHADPRLETQPAHEGESTLDKPAR